jgi:hypothetical protein
VNESGDTLNSGVDKETETGVRSNYLGLVDDGTNRKSIERVALGSGGE